MDNQSVQPNITIEPLDGASLGVTITETVETEVQAVPSVPVSPSQPEAGVQNDPPFEPLTYEDASIQEIDITKIVPNPFQPRKYFDQEALKELAKSIEEHGVIQPLVVSPTATGFEIVVGERRFRASQLANLQKVPAIVKPTMVDQTKLEIALIENIQRKDLNPIEEAQAYERLMETFSLTQEQVAKKVGRSRPAVANTVRLLNLPADVQRLVIEGRIMEGHARTMLSLQDPEKISLLAQLVMEKHLNVREVEQKVRDLTTKKLVDSVTPDPKMMALESELRSKLGTQVKIQKQGQGGKIMIEFFSEEELNEIIAKMAEKKEQAVDDSYLTV